MQNQGHTLGSASGVAGSKSTNHHQMGGVTNSTSTSSGSSKHYFYESNSKVISLKKFSDELMYSGTGSISNSIYHQSGSSKQANKDMSLQKWFESLLNHEKAIVLTVIDSELVGLVRQMHSMYS